MARNSDAVAHLDEALTELATTDPTTDGSGLSALCRQLADHCVIGLGEATHGTREFFELKHRIVRQLVEEHGLRLFGIEAGFGRIQRVNDYVCDGDGTARAAVENMGFWTWKAESVREFVAWLREFNADRGPADQVQFYGYDVQSVDGSATALSEYLATVDPAYLDTVGDDLVDLADGPLRPETMDNPDEKLASLTALADSVTGRLDTYQQSYAAITSQQAWRVAHHHASVVSDAIALARDRHAADDYTSATALERRDRKIAESVTWILDQEPHDQIALWAHNAHINRGGMEWDEESIPTMGDYLDEWYGDNYYALGFDFHHGAFRALGDDGDGGRELREFTIDGPVNGALSETLSATDYELAFLDITEINSTDASKCVTSECLLASIGAVFSQEDAANYWLPATPNSDFDGLVYVEETTASRSLSD